MLPDEKKPQFQAHDDLLRLIDGGEKTDSELSGVRNRRRNTTLPSALKCSGGDAKAMSRRRYHSDSAMTSTGVTFAKTAKLYVIPERNDGEEPGSVEQFDVPLTDGSLLRHKDMRARMLRTVLELLFCGFIVVLYILLRL
eukprot:scpid93664/ scgid17704/ 